MERTTLPAASAIFDPYEDRTARDIRNRLSVAFVKAVRSGDLGELLSAAERICPPEIGRVYCAFANDRMNQYQQTAQRGLHSLSLIAFGL